MLQINTRKKVKSSKLKVKSLQWQEASEIKKDLKKIIEVLDLSHIDHSRIFCYRTIGSKSRAYARIWSFPKIFQRALKIEPAYIIEVLSKYYDKLEKDEQKKVLIHELLHIPKNFSGALVPHRTRSLHIKSQADTLFRQYKKMVK